MRQFAEDCRRKIAVALHSLGDEINPQSRQPRFNRPEDAEGFMQSGAEVGLDGDEESRKKQREEIMYWNQVRLEREERETKNRVQGSELATTQTGANFDDFMQEDRAAEKGAYIFNTGSNYSQVAGGLLHRRQQQDRGLERGNSSANPFSDENNIEMEDVQRATQASLMFPEPSEMSEDIYGLETVITPSRRNTQTLAYDQAEQDRYLVDVSEPIAEAISLEAATAWFPNNISSASEAHPDAFASIQAWANNSNSQDASFYFPISVTPQVAISETSEPEHVTGELTPTDSASLAGSGDEIASFTSVDGNQSQYYDVVSDDEAGISTPGSWTEVGSVISDNDHPN